ncbi:MAG: dienelactone hydrolase family protein [Acidobacteriota bacterium]
MGKMITFASNGAEASGWLAEPATPKGKGVVVIQEWWGLTDHVKGTAERFAREGYLALAPDLYHGKVTKAPDEAGKLMMALGIAQAEKDLSGSVAYLKAATGKPAGTVGWCMGGALSLFAACAGGDSVGACVIYYGGHPKVTYDFDRLRAPVLGHWAEDDAWANSNIPTLEVELGKRGRRWEFHTYPKTQHAFFNDSRPEVYVKDAAEKSWQRTVAFFDANL